MKLPTSVSSSALLLALLAGTTLGLSATFVAYGVPSAQAQAPSVFAGTSLIELLRPTNVVGDGATPVDLYVLALYPDGTPIVGLALKLTATSGLAEAPQDQGGGLYRIAFTPMKTDAPSAATLTVKGKLPNKVAVERSWSFPIAVPRSRGLAVGANPARLTLGVDKTASVAFTFSGGDPRALAGVRLALNTSVGALSNVTNVGNGVFNGLYTTPAVSVPQLALVTAVDAGDPMRTYGGLAIPLTANVSQAVTGTPNTPIVLKVGGREFGPVKTDSKGRAKIPVVLPPGTTTATRVQAGANGTVTEDAIDLKILETRRIALFPTVAGIPSDARLRIPIRVMVVTPEGKPDEMASVAFTVSAGSIGPASHEGGGVYVAPYTPPDGNVAVKASLNVKLTNGAAVQSDTRPLMLVPVRASQITLTATPTVLPAAATSLTVSASVSGPAASPLAGRTLAWSANGAKLQGVTDLKTGSYDALFSTTGSGPVELTASVAAPVTGNEMTQLLVIPSQRRLPPDGLSSAMLTIVTLDEFGYPVPNVPLTIQLNLGDGAVPESATTNAAGIAEIYYTAGRTNGMTAIDVSAGPLSAGVSILQAPPELTAPALPIPSSASTRAMIEEWARSLAALRVERE